MVDRRVAPPLEEAAAAAVAALTMLESKWRKHSTAVKDPVQYRYS